MNRALIKIESLFDHLSRSEKRVANYILQNPQDIPDTDAAELAKMTGVSIASVSRLPKKIGYKSFRELKIDLARNTNNSIEQIYQDICPGDSDETVVKKVFGANITSLEDTLKILDYKNLVKAVKFMVNANQVIFLGMGSSGNIAQDASMRFSHLGFKASGYKDCYQMLTHIANLSKKDVVVGISHSGRSIEVVKSFILAKKNKIRTIGISNYLSSPVSENSDVFLSTVFCERKVRATALSPLVSQISLIDCLFVLAARYKKGIKIDHLDKIIDENLRI